MILKAVDTIAEQLDEFADGGKKELYEKGNIRSRVQDFLVDDYLGKKPNGNELIDKAFKETVSKMALCVLVPKHLSEEFYLNQLASRISTQVISNEIIHADNLVMAIKLELIAEFMVQLIYQKIKRE